MLSSYDYNPWMVPNGSSYQKRACCHGTLNPKVHDPFLLSRIAAKENLNRDNTFSSTLASEAVDKRMIMTIDLKPTIKESEKLRLSLKSLSISDQSSEKHISHTTNDPTLDDDPKDFYVKVVDFNACPQNITLLNQCKKMLERTFYTILSEDIKEIYKNKTSTPNQHLFSFENKDSSLNLDFTKLLYDPISQGKRYGSNNGYDLSGNNAQAGFNLTVNSMSDS
ncbi:hypothetical protein AX774_g308 [Zancudomyces culisetae]|uniref:Uncharacterized protein n=1 Tax=Zancudomyces culisetae TaxID=1213189 RepID=A0A1R1PYT5_ZANCU|nr:hypothetical protein AX774_g308 [Zancudomyces culisetae]|eukprot:OMH86122.1 hypothetical protein AX774_g308 [Zancudomyces culisetae]